MQPALNNLSVLDLADRAPIAGHMLAQLGAAVTQVEPPEGLAIRREAPWLWAAYGAGKISATVDLETEGGRDALRTAIAAADVLLESLEPGALAALGLDRRSLDRINPGLIHVSITPFGSNGPKAGWQATDLTLWAAGGPLFPNRDGSRPPLRISVPQAWLHAGADAAGAALIALFARGADGLGQHIDISVQQSVTQATLASILAEPLGHRGFNYGVPEPEARSRADRTLDLSGSGSRTRRSKWRVRDGLAEMHLGIGAASGSKTNNLFHWMCKENALPSAYQDWDWTLLPGRLTSGELSETDLEGARAAVAAFLSTKSKDDIVREAIHCGILMAPIYTVADLVDSSHHRARDFFQNAGPAGVLLPGDFAKGIAFRPLRPSPRIGRPLAISSPCIVARPREAPADAPALAGLKVLDLAWVVAGPAIGRVLADYGATVIRVESRKRVDTARVMGPFANAAPDLDKSACFDANNTGKLGVTLDLSQQAARGVVRDMVRWADVLVESFAPGQMARWGLGYDQLKALKPDLVMVSTSLMGQEGPHSRVAGFGNVGAAMAGFQPLVGWPDMLPIGPFGPYTDYAGPRFGLAALMAALLHRRSTGDGAWIDIAQAEAGIQFLAPEVARYGATGVVAQANGNRDPAMAPHGVFPCAGFDRWIAIAIRTDAEWRILAGLLGPEASDPQLATLAGRKECEDRLEALVSAWSRTLPANVAEARLQSVGIAAHVVSNGTDLIDDAQLKHRDHFRRLPRADGSESLFEASRFQLSRTPADYQRTAPEMGRDTDFVLRKLLRYDAATIERLRSADALM